MNSLTELNARSESYVIVPDNRLAKAVLDRTAISNDIAEYADFAYSIGTGAGTSQVDFTISPQAEILEVVNPDVAEVSFYITAVARNVVFLYNSNVTWAVVPSGMTILPGTTIETDGTYYYRYFGIGFIDNQVDWNIVREFIWTIPTNAQTYDTWFLQANIQYYDEEIGSTVTRTWDIYDPNHYINQQLIAETTATVEVRKTAVLSAAVSASSTFNFPGQRVRPFASTMSSVSSFSLPEYTKYKLFEANLVSTNPFNLTAKVRAFGMANVIAQTTMTINARKDVESGSTMSAFSEQNVLYTNFRPSGTMTTEPNIANLTCDFLHKIGVISPQESSTDFTAEGFQYYGIIQDLPSTAVQTTSANFDWNFRKALTAVATTNTNITKISQFIANVNMTAVSTLVADGSVPMRLLFNISKCKDYHLLLGFVGTTNVLVDWGDGTTTTYTTPGKKRKIYSNGNTREVKIYGNTQGFSLNNAPYTVLYPTVTIYNEYAAASQNALEAVYSFGAIGLTSCDFQDSVNLTRAPTQIASTITDCGRMFMGCWQFNDSRVVGWNMSNVTSILAMFHTCLKFNQPIGSWNVSNVQDMRYLFWHNYVISGYNYTTRDGVTPGPVGGSFNQNLNSWNTSNVRGMGGLFRAQWNFNQPLSNWDTANVYDMADMFEQAKAFNQPIARNGNKWNTENVGNPAFATLWSSDGYGMNGMFDSASSFNQDISNWRVPYLTSKPLSFDRFTTSGWTTAEKPVWGSNPA